MDNGRRIARLASLALLALLAGCPNRGAAPSAPPGQGAVADSSQFTTGVFDGCAPEGSGGDRTLNRLKNRDVAPPTFGSISIAELLGNHPGAAERVGRTKRSLWPQSALAEVAPLENRGVQVEGYLARVRQQGPESCNCDDSSRRDYHLWVVASPTDDRSSSVVMEVSPRLLPRHPNWKLRILSRLAHDTAHVRISGWLMWDQEHPDQVGQTRRTLWEVHPIHRIEVWSGGQWRDLDG